MATWAALAESLPVDMTIEELFAFFSADNDSDRRSILDVVNQRLGAAALQPPQPKRIRILTMHGAKGMSAKVVFIPSLEQGIMPSFRVIQATGLVIEQRRLFYSLRIVRHNLDNGSNVISHYGTHSWPGCLTRSTENWCGIWTDFS